MDIYKQVCLGLVDSLISARVVWCWNSKTFKMKRDELQL